MAIKPFPELSEVQQDALVTRLQHWSLANGLVMYPPAFEAASAAVAPVTLFPTPFPRRSFKTAVAVQKTFNELYVKLVTLEKLWLVDIMQSLSQFDRDFTGKLFETYTRAQALGCKQPLSLGLFRLDYMVNDVAASDPPAIKQIEFNTVSVSFGGLLPRVGQLHAYLNQTGSYDNKYLSPYYDDGEVPVSLLDVALARGLALAAAHYSDTPAKTVVLFVVQPGERNCFDQRHLEYELLRLKVRSFRVTLEEAESLLTVNQDKLYVAQTMDEVLVVYYRLGYSPADYASDPAAAWSARLFLENTTAIKCPLLLTQLSGAKKVQQLLTQPELVQRLLPGISALDLDRIMSTFVKIYPLDLSPQGQVAKRLAFSEPENFVLKPQREGGGNNIYKKNIPQFLQSLDELEWGAYILMELINPPKFANKIIRNSEVYTEDIISELGIFGTVLFNEELGQILHNEDAGFLLRSKFSSSNEGGVAAGFGCVDSVYLHG